MRERGLRKRNLREDYKMSPTLIKRLTDNANVAVDTIMHLCEILNCQPGDIMEYINNRPTATERGSFGLHST